MKSYHTRKSARIAVKKAGMEAMEVRYDTVTIGKDTMVVPVVICELREDYHEVNRRGFNAEMLNQLADA